MPTYTIEDKNTGDIFEIEMSIADKEAYMKANPHLQQILHKINIGDSVKLGITKPPEDFQKGVIGRIAESVPGNTIKEKSKFQIPREW